MVVNIYLFSFIWMEKVYLVGKSPKTINTMCLSSWKIQAKVGGYKSIF